MCPPDISKTMQRIEERQTRQWKALNVYSIELFSHVFSQATIEFTRGHHRSQLAIYELFQMFPCISVTTTDIKKKEKKHSVALCELFR